MPHANPIGGETQGNEEQDSRRRTASKRGARLIRERSEELDERRRARRFSFRRSAAVALLPLLNDRRRLFPLSIGTNPGPGSIREDCSAPMAGIASLTTDSYSRRASRHSGQTARCSWSRFCSSSLSWPEVETAQSSRNSSWGPLGNNAPAPTMARTFYHTASLPGNLPAEICFRNLSRPR